MVILYTLLLIIFVDLLYFEYLDRESNIYLVSSLIGLKNLICIAIFLSICNDCAYIAN